MALVEHFRISPSGDIIEAAHRLYKLALNRGFTRGRRVNQVCRRYTGCTSHAGTHAPPHPILSPPHPPCPSSSSNATRHQPLACLQSGVLFPCPFCFFQVRNVLFFSGPVRFFSHTPHLPPTHRAAPAAAAAQVAATCLYIVCRQENKPYMLIDLSDHLSINVYTLGGVYLELVKLFRLDDHPAFTRPIDPSLFLHRFVDRLKFGDKAPVCVWGGGSQAQVSVPVSVCVCF